VSIGGFNYQASHAVARLAAMLTRRPALDLDDWPTRIRYDWGEDLDEVCNGGTVCFTQCKRQDGIGQPAALASVLVSFAPKWLWFPDDKRDDGVRFRLVAPDPRLAAGGHLSSCLASSRDDVRAKFLDALADSPGPRTDRAVWQGAAEAYGPERLFDDLWQRTDLVYLQTRLPQGHPAGSLLLGEEEALDLLLRYRHVDPAKQSQALAKLRQLIHHNLIAFDPGDDTIPDLAPQTPHVLTVHDVGEALYTLRLSDSGDPPFDVVDKTYLAEQRALPKKEFVARPADWADVVHGADDTVKFVERDQTEELEQRIREALIAPLERGSDRGLRVMFVLGPPGAGKTTLAKRVCARLVEDGTVVVADVGLNLGSLRVEPERYLRELEQFAGASRPVLLIADDPLFDGSEWVELLNRLAAHAPRIAVVAPSPQFLYDRHQRQLRGPVQRHTFQVAPPSVDERVRLARLHGRDELSPHMAEGDFLVLSMEAAAGVSFDKIIQRLWETLNGGSPIAAAEFPQLSWPVRAYMVTCFFHRAYVPCPEPLLRAALEASGGVGEGVSVPTALAQLRHERGWHVFQVRPRGQAAFEYQGETVAAAHHRIAQRAWDHHPVPWFDLDDLVAAASLTVPETIRDVASLAATLAEQDPIGGACFAEALVARWAAASEDIDTRLLYDLQAVLGVRGHGHLTVTLVSVFRARAVPGPDGWLAALALWFFAERDELRSFPADLDLQPIIEAADLSLPPTELCTSRTGCGHPSTWPHSGRAYSQTSSSGDLDGQTAIWSSGCWPIRLASRGTASSRRYGSGSRTTPMTPKCAGSTCPPCGTYRRGPKSRGHKLPNCAGRPPSRPSSGGIRDRSGGPHSRLARPDATRVPGTPYRTSGRTLHPPLPAVQRAPHGPCRVAPNALRHARLPVPSLRRWQGHGEHGPVGGRRGWGLRQGRPQDGPAAPSRT
jgi:ABC-type cobalamin/Fe3+-siderophores transport system ATPase subunit